MKIRNSNTIALAVKPRPILQVGGMLALISLALLMLMMHHQDKTAIKNLKTSLQSVFVPVIETLSKPAEHMRGFADNVEELVGLYYRNKTLEQQNATLLKWQTVAQQLQNENQELRSLLGVKAIADAGYVTATVVSRTHDPLRHTLLIRHESNTKNIVEGLPVLAAEGIIGHVIEVRGDYAEVLLITDRQSRIPVEHEVSGQRGILVGTNYPNVLNLNHVEHPGAFEAGDRIVTSSSELFPVNMVVGEVGVVSERGISIVPYTDARKLHYVSIAVPNRQVDMVKQ